MERISLVGKASQGHSEQRKLPKEWWGEGKEVCVGCVGPLDGPAQKEGPALTAYPSGQVTDPRNAGWPRFRRQMDLGWVELELCHRLMLRHLSVPASASVSPPAEGLPQRGC